MATPLQSFNIALSLTALRLFLVLPLIACFVIGGYPAMQVALALIALAGLTDFLDGRIARARNEVTKLGAALDPIADKCLVVIALIGLMISGQMSDWAVWGAMLIILREVFVAGLREALGPSGNSLPVSKLAKWKTTAQFLAIAIMVAQLAFPALIYPLATPAGVLLVASIALTIWTGFTYSLNAARVLGS